MSSLLRRLLWITFGLGMAAGLHAQIPALLREALTTAGRDDGRWAYTETETSNPDGKEPKTTIVRFDPSKPYDEQYTPLLVDGKPPTKSDLAEHRRRGERRGERIEREIARGEVRARRGTTGAVERAIDPEGIAVESENAAAITYRVMARRGATIRGFPVEKVELLIRVNKQTRALENIRVTLLDPLRLYLVAKVQAFTASIDFTKPDPKFPALLSNIRADGRGRIAVVVSRQFHLDRKRTDFVRVTPYNERFVVEPGVLQLLDEL